eukprot:snap_masked-scaffold_2-processed-gene-16.13-mRNA-1 protein AED:1.00 eAED:1.00 QI:0/0/0/0/1/1/2/0/120
MSSSIETLSLDTFTDGQRNALIVSHIIIFIGFLLFTSFRVLTIKKQKEQNFEDLDKFVPDFSKAGYEKSKEISYQRKHSKPHNFDDYEFNNKEEVLYNAEDVKINATEFAGIAPNEGVDL